MEAFASFGYKPEHVTKILLIHKREDNSGELRFFSDSKIYVDKDETSEDKLQCIPNLMLVAFTGGAYYSFPES